MATFIALLCAYGLSQFYRAFLAVVAADVARDLGLDQAQLAGLSACWLYAFALAQLPVGFALDRFGPRRTMIGFMVGAVAGSAWLASARSYGGGLGAEALLGIGCASNLIGGFYVIARTVPVVRFAFMSSVLLALGSLGDPLSGAPMAWLAGTLGWRGAMLAMTGLTILTILALAIVLRDPAPVRGLASTNSMRAIREVVRIRALWPILPMAFIGYAVVISVRGLWIAPYLDTVHGMDAAARNAAATGMGLAIAAGAFAYPFVARALGGTKRAVLFGASATGLVCLLLAALPSPSPIAASAGLIALGCFGITFAMVITHARSFLPTHLLGAGTAFVNLVSMGGAGSLQWASGRLVHASETAGYGAPVTFSYLFVAFGAALLAASTVYVIALPAPRETP